MVILGSGSFDHIIGSQWHALEFRKSQGYQASPAVVFLVFGRRDAELGLKSQHLKMIFFIYTGTVTLPASGKPRFISVSLNAIYRLCSYYVLNNTYCICTALNSMYDTKQRNYFWHSYYFIDSVRFGASIKGRNDLKTFEISGVVSFTLSKKKHCVKLRFFNRRRPIRKMGFSLHSACRQFCEIQESDLSSCSVKVDLYFHGLPHSYHSEELYYEIP